MAECKEIKAIARIENDFSDKFGVPRQSGLVEKIESKIIFENEYRNPDALRGIEEFSHLWLIWDFSECTMQKWQPTVRPPRLGGNTRKGVFATRSPYRPNSLGLSSVKLERIEDTAEYGKVLIITGADLLNGTPIYDIKPYLPYTDSHPEARGSFGEKEKDYHLEVVFDENLLVKIPYEKRDAVKEILAQDPRPAYHNEPERVYGMSFGGYNIKFTVSDGVLTVSAVEKL